MATRKAAIRALQTAVYGILSGDATLGAVMTGGVYDAAPPEATLPYVKLGAFRTARVRRVFGGGASYHHVVFDVELHDDESEADTIAQGAERVAALLDDVAFAVSDFSTVYCHLTGEDKDPIPELGVVRMVLSFEWMGRRT